jgi:dTDP-4-dehydrorhamnose reductase
MRVLVLGATGLLGNTVYRVLAQHRELDVYGTCRVEQDKGFFVAALAQRLLTSGDLQSNQCLSRLFESVRPDVVVNCLGARRMEPLALDASLAVYAVMPKRLAVLCRVGGARLVQVSSDGVFSGARGRYSEDDLPDATDIYGIAKLLGEISEPNAITLRTSMIGPELKPGSGLLEWFLARHESCRCYTRAIFSGLPTFEIGRVIRDFVIPRPQLHGVYHVAAAPISKYDLLCLVAKEYGKTVEIIADDSVVIDRSLNGERFNAATSYSPPPWPSLVQSMHSFRFGLATP